MEARIDGVMGFLGRLFAKSKNTVRNSIRSTTNSVEDGWDNGNTAYTRADKEAAATTLIDVDFNAADQRRLIIDQIEASVKATQNELSEQLEDLNETTTAFRKDFRISKAEFMSCRGKFSDVEDLQAYAQDIKAQRAAALQAKVDAENKRHEEALSKIQEA